MRVPFLRSEERGVRMEEDTGMSKAFDVTTFHV